MTAMTSTMPGVATLADIETIEARGLPADLPRSSYGLLQRTAQVLPHAPALSAFLDVDRQEDLQTLSYRDLLAQVTRAANAFHSLGAGKDSVVAIVLPNLAETHVAIWGAQAAGIAAPINPMLAPEAIADLIEAAGASVVVTFAPLPGMDLWLKLHPALRRVRCVRHVLLVDVGGGSGDGDSAGGRRAAASRSGSRDAFRIHDFSWQLRQQPDDRLLSGRRFEPEDGSSYLYTGGTTGAPKLAMRSHANEVANAWSCAQCFGDALGPGKNVFCGLPLFHANGLLVTGLLPFLVGAHVIVGTPSGFRHRAVVENFWRIVERHRIHCFSAVPTVYGALLQVPRAGHQLDSLQFGLCGAAPMPPGLIERFERETGIAILEGYGLTEGTCVSSLNPPLGTRKPGSIGLRLPGQAMKAVVLDHEGVYVREVHDGESGTIVISGPNVFAGYRQARQDRTLWPDLGDGVRWLNTGDLGYRDNAGYFWLTGRSKDIIVRGGHNIDPALIEQPLYAHPAVRLAAAVGLPDMHAGELPAVYVQPEPGQALTVAELRAHLERSISERAAMPVSIMLVDAMPLTAVGKIDKPELRRRAAADALRAALSSANVALKSLSVSPGPGGQEPLVTIAVADPRSRALADEVIGRFALPCRIVWDLPGTRCTEKPT